MNSTWPALAQQQQVYIVMINSTHEQSTHVTVDSTNFYIKMTLAFI